MALGVGEYAVGALAFAGMAAACIGAAWLIVARRLAGLRGLERALAVFGLGTGAIVIVHLVPAAVGVLTREVVVGCALALLAVARAVPRARAVPGPPRPAAPPDDRASAAVAIGAAGLAGVAAVAYLISRSDEPVVAIDAVTMHLATAARFLQADSLWPLVSYAPELAPGTYPHNGTLLMVAATLPWESTFAARYVNAPFVVATAATVFAFARAVGAPRSAGALAGVAVASLPMVAIPAFEQAQVDAPMLAWFAIGSLFALHSARSGSLPEAALAGAALGLAFGTKWYAVPYVPLVAAIWAVALRRNGLLTLRRVLALVVPLALLGGFWLIRNLVLTGNPFHPARVEVLGLTLLDAPPDPLRERAGANVAQYLFDFEVWREWLVRSYGLAFGLLGPLMLAGILGAAIALWRGPRPGAVVAVLGASIALGAVYTILPDTAFGLPGQPVLAYPNARYLVPALLAAAVLLGWLARRRRVRRLLEAALLVGILDGLRRSFPGVEVIHLTLAAAVVGTLALVAWAGRRRPVALAGLATVGVISTLALLPDSGGPSGYARYDPVLARAAELPDGSRIGLAKTWTSQDPPPVLPLFGERLRNRVESLGRLDGAFLRLHRAKEPFQAQLRERRYDALLIGRGATPRPGAEEPEARWARELGYREVADAERYVLYAR